MARKFENLFSPLKVGGVTLKNRIISAPMTYPILTADGCLTPEAAAFYELRAKGGAAVVTVSELIVDGATGKYYPVQVVTDAPNAKDGLANAARAVYRHGAIASMELSHGGRYAIMDGPTWGPSDVYDGGVLVTRKMTKAVIDGIVECYARSAELCRDAGFEMLLIHAGHGWLLEQFLSPATNGRDDNYGGSLQNRARLALEVIGAVRSAVGPGFPLELRISAQEYMDGGYSLEDVIAFAKLVEDKIDLLQVSTGSHHDSFDKTHPSMFMDRGVNVHYAETIKKHITKIPIATIGGLNEPEMLEDIIASGRADAVVMGRALLADPYLPNKAREGRDDEIVRCYRCFTCMAERIITGLRVCAVNPVIGSEYEHNFMPSRTEAKKVLIAGGGPAGMQCAITAAERGHEVTLCEKSGALGGALKAERSVPFKSDLYKFIDVKAIQLKKAGVDVRLNTEVTPEFVRDFAPDALIIAVGSEPIVPPIPGIERAIVADDLSDVQYGQRRVAIIGGGLVGCETAVHLAREGHDVTVIEMGNDICIDANPRHRPLLIAELRKSVNCMTAARAVLVNDEGVVCETEDGETLIPADTVICAAGRRASRETALALRDTAPYVDEIGDCVKPANVARAVFRGHFAALDI